MSPSYRYYVRYYYKVHYQGKYVKGLNDTTILYLLSMRLSYNKYFGKKSLDLAQNDINTSWWQKNLTSYS